MIINSTAVKILSDLEVEITSKMAEYEIDLCLILDKVNDTWKLRGEGEPDFIDRLTSFTQELNQQVIELVDLYQKEAEVLKALYELTGDSRWRV